MPRVDVKLVRGQERGTLTYGGKTIAIGVNADIAYPADKTIDTSLPGYKKDVHFSAEFGGARMPWSVLWIGQRGIYFHEAPTLEGSAGCVHLLAPDAKDFYDWTSGRIRVVVTYTAGK